MWGGCSCRQNVLIERESAKVLQNSLLRDNAFLLVASEKSDMPNGWFRIYLKPKDLRYPNYLIPATKPSPGSAG